ncbi:hypothetical protein QAD02_002293 [Eretmocerus hayati]|uniref:Uncharacterized protein n=1 Tax=Eretmocerus hayati TaxID=131215 RepID=A0ACC2NIH0_9HYME|nr:hypothetical protein QAD02_002293 [Eretmocerus hayati]
MPSIRKRIAQVLVESNGFEPDNSSESDLNPEYVKIREREETVSVPPEINMIVMKKPPVFGQNRLVNRHLVTYFIPKGDSSTLHAYLKKPIVDHNLSITSVLTLGCDGPNVNKAVIAKFNELLLELGSKEMIDIGTCLLHVVNNVFQKGVESLSIDINDYLTKLYYCVNHSDFRVEILQKFQLDLGLPIHDLIKHVPSRWLTIGQASDRAFERSPAIENLILEYIPKNDKITSRKSNYLQLRELVANPLTEVYLNFVSFLAKIFTRQFTLLMQKEQPLIHILHRQMTKLVYILTTQVMKESFIPTDVLDIELKKTLQNSDALYPLEEVKCGDVCLKSV